MIEVPVLDNMGAETSSVKVDEAKLGGRVRLKLLKEAVLMYEANKRQGTASTKSRGEVRGSTRKLFRQKGTGNARMGSARSPARVGGGVAFGPKPRDYGWQMPRKQRQLATRSALLAKVRDGEVRAIETIPADQVKTKALVAFVKSLALDGTVLLVSAQYSRNLVLSGKNIPNVAISNAADLNAHDLLKYKWIVMETSALQTLAGAES